MGAPRRLVDWPWVTVEVECSLCRRAGRYRLARLAERHGAAIELGPLLRLLAGRCGLDKPGVEPRQYEAQCGARFRVPPGGPRPEGAPAREAQPGEAWPARPRRRGPEGPLPTVEGVRRQGVTHVEVHCYSWAAGVCCHHSAVLALDALALPDDLPMIHIVRVRRLRCRRCGRCEATVAALWPSVQEDHARRAWGDAPAPREVNGVFMPRFDQP